MLETALPQIVVTKGGSSPLRFTLVTALAGAQCGEELALR